MEIVVNRCFGGFGLSHKAVMRIAELKGIKLYPVVDKTYKDIYKDKATLDNPNVIIHYYTVPEKEYQKIYEQDKKKRNYADSNAVYFSERRIERNDTDLVKVVKELGDEANGSHAELEVVTIPNNISWEIEDYDGMEHVSEKHRTW